MTINILKYLRLWLPVLGMGWIIYYLSSIPSLNTGWGLWDFALRKGAHIVEFFLFTFFLMRASLQTWSATDSKKIIIWALVAAAGYSVLDEIHQSFVPGRGPSFVDVLVDSIGILMALLLYRSSFRLKLFHGLILLMVLGFVGCGPQGQFNRARKLEKKGQTYKAWEKYQVFAAENAGHALAPEALFRAGWIAQINTGDCKMAHTFFDRVMRRYPGSDPWAKLAIAQKKNCPDYFPLLVGSQWVEGDTQSGGEIARSEIECLPVKGESPGFPSEKCILVNSLFAGEEKVQTSRFIHKKREGELRQFKSETDPRYKVILAWPIEVGKKWAAKSDKRLFRYEIIEKGIDVKVKAGTFKDCIKVRSYVEGSGGAATNEYYAPGVGRVLKTVSTQNAENRVTELISYKLADWPDIKMREKD